jgi:hypothetical protein
MLITEEVPEDVEREIPAHRETFLIRMEPEDVISLATPCLCPRGWIPRIPLEVLPRQKRTLRNVCEFLM